MGNLQSIWQWVKSSSGCFHTRQFACKQSVADVQQARHFFIPYLLCIPRVYVFQVLMFCILKHLHMYVTEVK